MKIAIDKYFGGEELELCHDDKLRYHLYKKRASSMVEEMMMELILRRRENDDILKKIKKISFVVEVEE